MLERLRLGSSLGWDMHLRAFVGNWVGSGIATVGMACIHGVFVELMSVLMSK